MGGGILDNKYLDLELAAMMFAGILVFTLGFEHISEKLEASLAEQQHFLMMLAKVYRELMILGFISLFLVLSIEFAAPWIDQCDHTNLLHFEFAHLLIFFWAMVYVCNALISVARLSQTRRGWDRIANTETRVLCHAVEQRLMSTVEGVGTGDITKLRPDKVAGKFIGGSGDDWRPAWMSIFPLGDTSFEDMEWKIMQRLFLRNFKLPEEFDYSKYIQSKLMEGLAESLEVRPVTWLITITLSSIYVGISKLSGLISGDAHRRMLGAATSDTDANCTATESHRRMLGAAACDPCFDENAGKPALDEDTAVARITVVILFGWFLVLGQCYVVFFVKRGVHRLIRHQGCLTPNHMPLFLRQLDAQLDVRAQLGRIKIFEAGGEAFFSACSNKVQVKFFDPQEPLAIEGDVGDSMFFIVSGSVDIVDGASQAILAELGGGEFAGEMSLLLGIPRSKSLICSAVQNTPSQSATIAVLTKEGLAELGEEFPHVVEKLKETAEQRQQMSQMEFKVHLNALNRGGDSSPKKAVVGTIGGAGDHGHGHGHEHGGGTLPGMGEHHHGHKGSKMVWADDILPQDVQRRFDVFTELCLLFNCFYAAFYVAHMLFIAIPSAKFSLAALPLVNGMLIAPSAIIMLFLAPLSAKYGCLLTNVLERDDELVATVTSERGATIALRNQIRTALMHHGIRVAHEKNIDPQDITPIDVARYAFEMFDDDVDHGITYKELRHGLPEFQIFLTKNQFRQVCRIIDPDQNGILTLDDWLKFMQATDDDIKNNDWGDALQAVKLRGKVKNALLRPAMALYWETAPPGAPEPTLREIVDKIFDEIDVAHEGEIQYRELKDALDAKDVSISPDEFKQMVSLIDHLHGDQKEANTGSTSDSVVVALPRVLTLVSARSLCSNLVGPVPHVHGDDRQRGRRFRRTAYVRHRRYALALDVYVSLQAPQFVSLCCFSGKREESKCC
jgi:CRP-like cAMP-binding protein/Ca2+-binding EF-hand superfamily protein